MTLVAAQVGLAVSGRCLLLKSQLCLFACFQLEIRAALCYMCSRGGDAESLRNFRFLFQF